MPETPTPALQSQVTWLPGEHAVSLACPVCKTTHANRPLLRVSSLADGRPLTLYTCSSCASKFFDPPDISDFCCGPDDTDAALGFMSAKSYVEVGAGIWEMYWPAAVADLRPDSRLLDVGCGYGFTVDAWRRLRGEARGVELAEYGRLGARRLGVPIYSCLLENVAELAQERFDVVYASEVIEHVPDPQRFAQLLARYLNSNGVLCLTTPSADFISAANEGPGLLAALAPGFHGFMLSAAAMEQLLRACGFRHVLVRGFQERMIAWASQSPITIDEHSPQVREEYLRYLDLALASPHEADEVSDGFAYRHFRETVLAHDFTRARATLARLETSLAKRYALRVLDPEQALAQLPQCTTMGSFGAAYPYFLPAFYHLLGVYSRLAEDDPKKAQSYFRASRLMTEHALAAWGIHFLLEAISFLPDAWQNEAVCAATMGDPSVCEEWIAAVADGGPAASRAFGGHELTPREIESAFLEGLAILLAFDRGVALLAALQNCLRYLERQYGAWMNQPGATAPSPGSTLDLEQQMLLLFNIVKSSERVDHRRELAPRLLQCMVDLGQSTHPGSDVVRSLLAQARARLSANLPFAQRWAESRSGSADSYSTRPAKQG